MAESDITALETRLKEQDRQALAELFLHHRDRLWKMARFRMDPRLQGRVEPEDILQEAYMDAAKRLHHYAESEWSSSFLWLRAIVTQTMTDVYRRHLSAEKRDARREVAVMGLKSPDMTSASIAWHLFGVTGSPSGKVIQHDLMTKVEEAIQGMEHLDREVLALRHFEEMSNSEVATTLGIQPKAASIRYVRAIQRLQTILAGVDGFSEELGS